MAKKASKKAESVVKKAAKGGRPKWHPSHPARKANGASIKQLRPAASKKASEANKKGIKRLLRESRWPTSPGRGQLLLLVAIYGPEEESEAKKDQKKKKSKKKKGEKKGGK